MLASRLASRGVLARGSALRLLTRQHAKWGCGSRPLSSTAPRFGADAGDGPGVATWVQEPTGREVYESPFSRLVMYMKALSLTSCTAAVVAAPALGIASDPGVPLTVRVGMPLTILAMGVSTTGIFHWVVKPYVHRLWYEPANKVFTAELRSLFLRRRYVAFHPSEIRPLDNSAPFSSFQVGGVNLYVHSEGFSDRNALRLLTRRAPNILKEE